MSQISPDQTRSAPDRLPRRNPDQTRSSQIGPDRPDLVWSGCLAWFRPRQLLIWSGLDFGSGSRCLNFSVRIWSGLGYLGWGRVDLDWCDGCDYRRICLSGLFWQSGWLCGCVLKIYASGSVWSAFFSPDQTRLPHITTLTPNSTLLYRPLHSWRLNQ